MEMALGFFSLPLPSCSSLSLASSSALFLLSSLWISFGSFSGILHTVLSWYSIWPKHLSSFPTVPFGSLWSSICRLVNIFSSDMISTHCLNDFSPYCSTKIESMTSDSFFISILIWDLTSLFRATKSWKALRNGSRSKCVGLTFSSLSSAFLRFLNFFFKFLFLFCFFFCIPLSKLVPAFCSFSLPQSGKWPLPSIYLGGSPNISRQLKANSFLVWMFVHSSESSVGLLKKYSDGCGTSNSANHSSKRSSTSALVSFLISSSFPFIFSMVSLISSALVMRNSWNEILCAMMLHFMVSSLSILSSCSLLFSCCCCCSDRRCSLLLLTASMNSGLNKLSCCSRSKHSCKNLTSRSEVSPRSPIALSLTCATKALFSWSWAAISSAKK
ncbi:unnamed protein product [Moneuplotes crassus]|uniref:Uncharacterized protein n=1 Tax=Euplotes crassus TaxID=5936 RepID=A0AAD2DBX3_EUPCR|nr:unnamed protein product [Moneuplotes crassus]